MTVLHAVPGQALPDHRRPFPFALLFFLLAVTVFLSHFLFFRYSFPFVNVDEASFFSPACTLAAGGGLASPVHAPFLPGAGTYTYWMPPLYLVLLGGWLKLAGTTILAAKLFSALLVAATAWLITRLTADRNLRLWLAALVLVCPFILISSAFIRMEALGLLLVTASMVGVKKGAPAYALGALAGLCLMTHPVLLACSAALGLVALRKGWKFLAIFLLATLVMISPYLLYILKSVPTFQQQMALQFARKARATLRDLQPSYLLQSIPLCLLALYLLWRSKANGALRLFLATGTLLTLMVILKSNEFNYQVYTLPYVLGCMAVALEERPSRTYRFLLPLLIYGFFALLIFTKLEKYGFRSDRPYRQLVSYLEQHPGWKGRHIYVGGNPDVAAFFIEQGQEAERDIPIAASSRTTLANRYDFVADVLDNQAAPTDTVNRPWLSWPHQARYTPAGASFTLYLYDRRP